MRLLFLILFVLLVAVGVALLVREDPGYALLSVGPWTVELSLSLLVLLTIAAFVLFHTLIRTAGRLLFVPERMRRWRRDRREHKVREALNRGLMELSEGRWALAERTLLKHVSFSETPLLHYLGAARAAEQQGATARRDRYLHRAHEAVPQAQLAVGLTQAELQIARGQTEQALATLTHLQYLSPRHSYVLKLLVRLYRELKDWERLRELLPELRRHHVATQAEVDALSREVYAYLLEAAARSRDPDRLDELWRTLPRELKEDHDMLVRYVRYRVACGRTADLEPLVRGALARSWDERLVHLYGLLDSDDTSIQLASAEAWLRYHGRDAVLLLTLGRLALRHRLWGKARLYLESSLGVGPLPETYRVLGGLLERLGERDKALDCYRKGVAVATGAGEAPDELPAPATGEGTTEAPSGALTDRTATGAP